MRMFPLIGTTLLVGLYIPIASATTFTYNGACSELQTRCEGGLQSFIVPASGLYDIVAIGARGGAGAYGAPGGLGAEIGGDFNLTAGQELIVAVGGFGFAGGGGYGGGGGGGSFVVAQGPTPLVVAGGGGGGGSGPGGNGLTTEAGPGIPPSYVGGGGFAGDPTGSAGGGFYYGGVPSGSGVGGGSFEGNPPLYGSLGGSGGSGGFGGGGSGSSFEPAGGGGGGYTGGNGGGYDPSGGGGGGSYDGSVISNSDKVLVSGVSASDGGLIYLGNGLVGITQVTTLPPAPGDVPEPASLALLGTGLSSLAMRRRRS